MAALAVIAYGTLTLLAGLGLVAVAPAHDRDTYVLSAVRTLAVILTLAALGAALLT